MAILRVIVKEASMFTDEKKALEKKEEQMNKIREEFKKKLSAAKGIKGKDEKLYKEKVEELRDLEGQRKDFYKKVQKEKRELKDKIKKSKERIISELKKNQEEIFRNRHKFEKVNVEKLKEERKKLEKELNEIIGLKSTTKEELEQMSDEDRNKVKEAQKKYKENTKRIDEIDEKVDMANLYCGRKPQEMFKRNKIIMKKVEETFNIDKIDSIASDMVNRNKTDKEDKKKVKVAMQQQSSQPRPQGQNSRQETAEAQPQPQLQPQQEVQPYQNNNENNYFEEHNNAYFTGENIAIFEAEGIAVYNFGNQQGIIDLKKGREAKREKREMYKRLNLKKRVKGGTLRKVNPAIIKILEQVENGDTMIEQYLQSIGSKNQFNFQLKHDFTGLNIFQRLKMNGLVKREQKCGANVIGRLFQKNDKKIYAIDEPLTANVNTLPRAREMDSYVRADEETIHRTEQVGQRAGRAIEQGNQEVANENTYTQEDLVIE